MKQFLQIAAIVLLAAAAGVTVAAVNAPKWLDGTPTKKVP